MKIRVMYNKDETISIIWPAPKSRRGGETEGEWLERVFSKANPDDLPYDDVDTEQMPLPDKRFRAAWTKAKNGNGIEVDVERAKTQIMAELRGVRNKELARTDGLTARANEIGSQTESNKLMARRRRLRDLPQTVGIEAIKTVEELAATYPGKLSVEEYLDLASS